MQNLSASEMGKGRGFLGLVEADSAGRANSQIKIDQVDQHLNQRLATFQLANDFLAGSIDVYRHRTVFLARARLGWVRRFLGGNRLFVGLRVGSAVMAAMAMTASRRLRSRLQYGCDARGVAAAEEWPCQRRKHQVRDHCHPKHEVATTIRGLAIGYPMALCLIQIHRLTESEE